MLSGTYLGDLITTYMNHLKEVLHGDSANKIMSKVHEYLKLLGFPEPYPNAEQIAISLAAGIFTLAAYYIVCGKRHRSQRKKLQRELLEAELRVNELEEKIAEIEEEELNETKRKKKEIRVWMDGAFDMMHYGHMNAFRQGKALGTYLVVGINSDSSITECKGPPVMNDDERTVAVEGCKFVDEVEPNCPYFMIGKLLP